MAESTDGREVVGGRIGTMQTVANLERKPNAADRYSHIRVLLPNGKEVSLLFTDHQVLVAAARAAANPEDIPGVSWLRDNVLDRLP